MKGTKSVICHFDDHSRQFCKKRLAFARFTQNTAHICNFQTQKYKKKGHRHCINIDVLWWLIRLIVIQGTHCARLKNLGAFCTH